MSKTTLELYEARKPYFTTIWDRYNTDRELLTQKYVMKNSKGESIPGTISVTSNEAKLLANYVSSTLMGAQLQTVIEGTRNGNPLPAKQTSKLETIYNIARDAANDILKRRLQPNLLQYAANQITVMGGGARRVWISIKDDKYVFDILPINLLSLVYEIGTDGLWWGGYSGKRSVSLLAKEYPKNPVVNGDSKGEIEFVCIYDDTKEDIWINGALYNTRKHPFGRCPIIVEYCPAGFTTKEDGELDYEGESVFWLDRWLFNEKSRRMSIEQTLLMNAIKPPLQKEEDNLNGPPALDPTGIGKITKVKKDEPYSLIPTGDINKAGEMARADIDAEVTKGGTTQTDVGNVVTPTSAIWITEQTEIRNRLLNPRLQALGSIEDQTATMVFEQLKTLMTLPEVSKEMEVGVMGRTVSIKLADLEGDYTIRHKFMSKSPKQEIANLAMAQAAQALGIPAEIWVEDIYQYDKPEKLLAAMESDKAERDDPVIGMLRRAHALVDEADELEGDARDAKLIESQLLTDQATRIIKARNMPQITPEVAPQKEDNKPSGSAALIPLLGQKGLMG